MKVPILAKNIIFGGLYVDAEGIVESINHKTGERVEIQLLPKTSKVEIGSLKGKGFDAQGRHVIEVEGNWL